MREGRWFSACCDAPLKALYDRMGDRLGLCELLLRRKQSERAYKNRIERERADGACPGFACSPACMLLHGEEVKLPSWRSFEHWFAFHGSGACHGKYNRRSGSPCAYPIWDTRRRSGFRCGGLSTFYHLHPHLALLEVTLKQPTAPARQQHVAHSRCEYSAVIPSFSIKSTIPGR